MRLPFFTFALTYNAAEKGTFTKLFLGAPKTKIYFGGKRTKKMGVNFIGLFWLTNLASKLLRKTRLCQIRRKSVNT